jgi:hypothetical protein
MVISKTVSVGTRSKSPNTPNFRYGHLCTQTNLGLPLAVHDDKGHVIKARNPMGSTSRPRSTPRPTRLAWVTKRPSTTRPTATTRSSGERRPGGRKTNRKKIRRIQLARTIRLLPILTARRARNGTDEVTGNGGRDGEHGEKRWYAQQCADGVKDDIYAEVEKSAVRGLFAKEKNIYGHEANNEENCADSNRKIAQRHSALEKVLVAARFTREAR